LTLLGFATEGSHSVRVVVNFSDATSQGPADYTLTDWFAGSGVANFNRISRITNLVETGFALRSISVPIDPANRGKAVASISITDLAINPNARGVFYAVSGTASSQPVPTLSTWAMILFGVALVGAAMIYLQQHRITA
jgi:hypothetical protein